MSLFISVSPRDLIARRKERNLLLDKEYREKEKQVLKIIAEVRERGDQALFRLTEKFDGPALSDLRVDGSELCSQAEAVSPEFKTALKTAINRIRAYHETELPKSGIKDQEGIMLGSLVRPLERVGVYVPGGLAPYPSSVLMSAIPAQTAGVSEIIICTPPQSDGQIDPHILAAADALGLKQVFKVGGAQAVAAMAYGTKTIPRVDKIVGPGNIYVTLAKRFVFGAVDIDMVAGPSEIAVLADETADPVYVAADLLSQAEHDPLAAAVLITTDSRVVEQVELQIEKQLAKLPRRKIHEKSLKENGALVLVDALRQGVELVNEYAPEHLELLVKEPWPLLGLVKNAGAVFIGPYSPVPIGDYIAGPSHVLPTSGTARFFSGLGVDSFLRRMSVVSLGKEAFLRLRDDAALLAKTEGLLAHHNALVVRSDRR